jgi:LuxR family maltose regulon positive regulatory protein
MLAEKRFGEALDLLDWLREDAEAAGRMGTVIEILVLETLALSSQGDHPGALTSLERALTLAEPEGYIRIFLDEGETMRLLLAGYQSVLKKRVVATIEDTSLRLLTYTDKLLAAFTPAATGAAQQPGTAIEPLSERELEILRLISKGLSNQEIAEILVIAVSTVKSHINHLYGKLGTQRRTQAITIARDLGLLEERDF